MHLLERKRKAPLTLPRPGLLNPNTPLLSPTNINLIRNPNPRTLRTMPPILPLTTMITPPRSTSNIPRNRDLRRHHLIIILPNLRPVNKTLAIAITGDRATANGLGMAEAVQFSRARARVAGGILGQVREQVSEDGFQRWHRERD